MSYWEMALDAGYRGEEAQQMAQALEEQDRREWERQAQEREDWERRDEQARQEGGGDMVPRVIYTWTARMLHDGRTLDIGVQTETPDIAEALRKALERQFNADGADEPKAIALSLALQSVECDGVRCTPNCPAPTEG